MELFVARQPIFDARLNVAAYEILFRSGRTAAFDGSEENLATAKVINAIFGSAECEQIRGGKPAFINFPRALLLDESASILPPSDTVIEVLETVEPDDEVISVCRRLRARGFRLALDDYVPNGHAHPLIPLVDVLKVDFRLANKAQQRLVAERHRGKLQLLAEKVETREEFEQAAAWGYVYFQGYFFARPVIATTREIPGVKMNYLRILKEIRQAEIDFNSLTALLKREQSLSYKLLRFANSALFSRRTRIESVHQTLAFLGEDTVRKWLSVFALLDLTSDLPSELAVNTLVRARFAELLAETIGPASRAEDCFLMGMFSRLDAMLGRPIAELLDGLSLHEDIVQTLCGRHSAANPLAHVWDIVTAYERADWQAIDSLTTPRGINAQPFSDLYASAVRWADTASRV